MKERKVPYSTSIDVEIIVCDRCGRECEVGNHTEYHLNPSPTPVDRVGKIYTKHWSLDSSPAFPEGVEISSELTVDLCPSCDEEYVPDTWSPINRLLSGLRALFD